MSTSHIDQALARIQDIEGRLGILDPNNRSLLVPGSGPAIAAAGAAGVARPFDLALAQLEGTGGAGKIGQFSPQVETLISKYSAQNGLDPNLVRAVIKQESGGNPQSISAAGAQGLMQLMPETAAGYGVQNALDPEQNVAAGTRHLAGMLHEFGGDLPKALAAYNAGAGAVKRYGGVPPYSETQRYVQNIMGMLGKR
jgi:soluble lytic murein transglycosylase-like protein